MIIMRDNLTNQEYAIIKTESGKKKFLNLNTGIIFKEIPSPNFDEIGEAIHLHWEEGFQSWDKKTRTK